MGDPFFASALEGSVGIASLGTFLALGATGLLLSARALRVSLGQRGEAPERPESRDDARHVWRTGGVLVNDRYGVPSAYPAGGLTLEVCDEELVIRRGFRAPLRLHFRDIERLERIRRPIGAHTTRLHRGVGRSRVDLNLEPEQHEALCRWHTTRGRVDRIHLSLAEVRELDFSGRQRVLAMRSGAAQAWTVVRGVSRELELASQVILERRQDDRGLHHLRARGCPVRPRRLRITPSWKGRLGTLPQVFVLEREVAWPELGQALEGARTYR